MNKETEEQSADVATKALSRADLEIRRGRFDRPSDDEADVRARLAQDGRHLVAAHPTQVDVTDLQDVVA